MAHAITFKPAPVDYHQELMKRVENAPREHAEALLVLWEVLETAHKQGVLELVEGVIGGKDIIAGKLAESARLPESVAAIRNGIALARVLGSIDPDMLQRFAKGLDEATRETAEREKQAAEHGTKSAAAKAPSLWGLLKQVMSEDARRGIGFATSLLVALGRATKGEAKHG